MDNASQEALGELEGVEVVRAPRRLSLGGARNLGLATVVTPYALFWDADDLMPAGTLSFLLGRLSARPDLIAVAAGIVEDEPRVRHRWPPRFAARLARRPRLFAFLHAIWSMLPTTGGTLMRTGAAREGGGFDDADSGDDWVLGVSLPSAARSSCTSAPAASTGGWGRQSGRGTATSATS